MNRLLVPIAMVGLICVASPAFADDDVVTAAGKAQQNKVMEECMTKQAASNAQMSKADLRKVCEEQMQAQKDSADKMSGAPPK
jgi:hypothetical protein